MCGIIAYLGGENIKQNILLSLQNLCNRGYDSVGIMLNNSNNKNILIKHITDNSLAIEKLSDSILHLKDNYKIAIGHTRWATHGPKTINNAHPHCDNDKKFYLVHNGIIENYKELKSFLIKNNYTFYSQTDTEVIVNLLSYYYSKSNNIKDAINNVVLNLNGTYGICFYLTDTHDTLYCFKNGSPIVISINDSSAIISSEISGFNNLTNKYFVLDNNDYCIISYKNNEIVFESKNIYKNNIIEKNILDNKKGDYEHWTLKEIYEQKNSIQRALNYGARIKDIYNVKLGGLENMKDELKQLNNLLIIGCGTSYYASKIGKKYFYDLTDFDTINYIDGCEMDIIDIPKKGKTGAILLSQSGETRDLYNCLTLLKEKNILCIGVVNVINSLIAREVECGVYLNAGPEIGVASTKSFTSQLVILKLIALWFSNYNNKKKIEIEGLQKIHLEVNNFLKDVSFIKEYSSKITKFKSLFLLGKGKLFNIAEEGALKIKELSYCHAEAYSGSALKHGPFSLLEKDFPVILLIKKDKYYDKMCSVYEEIKSRNADILVITDDVNFCHKQKIIINSNNSISEILFIIPLQLIAYYMAINKNNNPDYPRNLAKVVTVE
jgi:glucosamine--fructose-6-phosphate aminotransferase (isomerizing)